MVVGFHSLHGSSWSHEVRSIITSTRRSVALASESSSIARSRLWFQICFQFSPLFGEDPHVDSYFSKGLKPPTR